MDSSLQQSNTGPLWRQLLAQFEILENVESAVMPTPPSFSSTSVLIKQCLTALVQPGQLVELRILEVNKRKRADSGYFDRPHKLAKAVASYHGKAEGLYFTINPVNPVLFVCVNNRVKEDADHTTTDSDVEQLINLPIDFDPMRPLVELYNQGRLR